MSMFFPQCMNCKWFNVENKDAETCAAFPVEISEDILRNKVDHRKPVDGDGGKQYEPRDPSLPHPLETQVATHYSDDEPRDDHGRWTDGGGGTATEDKPAEVGTKMREQPSSAYPPANKDGKDTLERYRKPDGTWTPERQALHDEIKATRFAGKTPVDRPTITVMGGGYGTGKSTFLEQQGFGKGNVVVVDPDAIKTELPEYNELSAALDPNAASFAHEESSLVGKDIVKEAVAGGFNILIDGSGDNTYDNLKGKVAGYRAKGAPVIAHYLTVDPDEALRRANARAAKSGGTRRFVPEALLRENHYNVTRAFHHALEDGLFDEATLWNAGGKLGSPRTKIATARGGKITIHDSVEWNKFLDRGHLGGRKLPGVG